MKVLGFSVACILAAWCAFAGCSGSTFTTADAGGDVMADAPPQEGGPPKDASPEAAPGADGASAEGATNDTGADGESPDGLPAGCLSGCAPGCCDLGTGSCAFGNMPRACGSGGTCRGCFACFGGAACVAGTAGGYQCGCNSDSDCQTSSGPQCTKPSCDPMTHQCM